MKKKFNPDEWLENKEGVPNQVRDDASMEGVPKQEGVPKPRLTDGQEVRHDGDDVELVISRIEAAQRDITSSYADWLNIGFAMADGYGERGRDYFHRVSRFYPGYSMTECNKQFDQCLKAKGHGITIKTFYHLAKQAGIDVKAGSMEQGAGRRLLRFARNDEDGRPEKGDEAREEPNGESEPVAQEGVEDEPEVMFNAPQLPSELYDKLPELLQESADLFSDSIEKDVFLIGAIAVLSGCLPNIEGIYFDEPNSAHLYTFITAPAGSGKGKMKWSKYFGQSIHNHLVAQSHREREDFEVRLEQYNNLTKAQRQGAERPEEPPRRMFFIPANSSSSAFIQALADNNFRGVLFETEADTLADTFKQEWGNFSDVLRKAFHHESTSMFRRKDSEFIEIRDPHMAIALSGTPKQVHHMIPDVENGLFSRFLYYAFEDNSEFKNPFVSHRPVNYTDFFNQKAKVVYELYEQLQQLPEKIRFQLTEEQGDRFTSIFNTMLGKNKLLLGRDFDANIKRLGLITFRIAMILSALRIMEEGELPNPMICSDLDFETAMTIATTLEKHAISVFKNLPNNELKGIKLTFFEKLPAKFDRKGYLKVAEELGIPARTAEKYIGRFKLKLLKHEHNQYTKI